MDNQRQNKPHPKGHWKRNPVKHVQIDLVYTMWKIYVENIDWTNSRKKYTPLESRRQLAENWKDIGEEPYDWTTYSVLIIK